MCIAGALLGGVIIGQAGVAAADTSGTPAAVVARACAVAPAPTLSLPWQSWAVPLRLESLASA